jgi:uncharacterized protein (TIGR03083 family)
MTTDADAPTDVLTHPMAVAYRATRARITGLAAERLDDATAGSIVPACPDWTVRQLCSHLAGVCADLVAGNRPSGDVQAWVDAQVEARADRSVGELIDEWNAAGPAFEQLIVDRPKGYAGLLYDIVAHEHDLRAVVGSPGARDSDGVRLSVDIVAASLTRDLAVRELGAVQVVSDDGRWLAGEGEPALTLDLTGQQDGTWQLLRALGSRRSTAQLRAMPWVGDLDRYLPAIAHQPLPVTDLVE